jgi:hypothetical protein
MARPAPLSWSTRGVSFLAENSSGSRAVEMCNSRGRLLGGYGRSERGRREVVERAMRADLVVVDPPSLDRAPRVLESREPVPVEALVSELAIETLDERVLVWFPGVDEVKRDSPLFGLCQEGPARELGAVVDHHRAGQAMRLGQLVQESSHSYATDGRVHQKAGTFAAAVVDDVERAKPAT